MDIKTKVVGHLCFVNFQVATDKQHNKLVVGVALVNNGLATLFLVNLQVVANFLDGVHVWCVNLCQILTRLGANVLDDVWRRFHIGTVTALGADNDGVLANVRQKHKFVGDFATHHAGVGCNGNNLGDAGLCKNAFVCLVALVVVLFQIRLASVEGVSILHCEFAHANKSGLWTRLIAEFCLDLVNHKGVFVVTLTIFAHKLNGRLFVSHAKYNRATVAVVKANKFLADGFVSAGLLPNGCRHNHRETYLLAVDGVHFPAHDGLEFASYALKWHKGRKNSVRHVFHVATAHHQRMAFYCAICWFFFESFANKFFQFHSSSSNFVYELFLS